MKKDWSLHFRTSIRQENSKKKKEKGEETNISNPFGDYACFHWGEGGTGQAKKKE